MIADLGSASSRDPGAPPFALRRPPTPLTGTLDVIFSPPMTAPGLFAGMGRRMVKRDVGGMGPGVHQVRLAEPGRPAPDVHWLRLAPGKHVRSEKFIVEH